jgi:D-alanyl-D-alanine carboxypeptidase
MRPPEHWHARQRRPRANRRLRSSEIWWTPPDRRRQSSASWLRGAALVGVIFAAGILFCRVLPSGGAEDGAAPVSEVLGEQCVAGVDCPAEGGTGAYVESTSPPPQVTARGAAVYEAPCNVLLYGRNIHQRFAPASLTKIATALVAAERSDLSNTTVVDVNGALLAESTNSTVMGLEPGMELSLRDLLYGLLLPSGNDAAIAIAEAVGGSVQGFVQLMNAKAAALGLTDTHFSNPHGLDEAGLYTSARDIALLGEEALDDPELADIVRTKTYQPLWDGPPVWNGNELLNIYPSAIGVKIGYTEKAGQTIVAAAERDGRRVVVSILSSWDRYSDASQLLDWAFDQTSPACAAVSSGSP